MLIAERQQNIVRVVNERKSVRVSELSEIFSVTEETIRRDLEKLEKEKKLLRSHGGAISMNPSDSLEIPYKEREIINVAEKQNIALEAVKLVKEGDNIILDASTTAWYMAKSLPDIPITVLTNSIKVAMELGDKKQITVISTGGALLGKSLSFVGPLAEASLSNYYVNKAFISCKGLQIERGISESDEQQAKIKKKMIESTSQVYIMVDYSKIGKQAFSLITGIEDVDYIITDTKADKVSVQNLKEKQLNVIIAQDSINT
ncbi:MULTISPECIES: DeoR/GlpR family DNA-binding transcription regulator [Virgibacillus]|uniref:DeoR faimly transcriptional regulator n=1 Tax=Virgibacillus pantothenticus TaxID=1473 RepID=A0A0L0QJI4_VIRPA|nr:MULTISPECIES: DeoR/GlpR family DNA-binding transcription regulator [Virgibacillus]API92948.1 DeoR family transcriptional regulator [Virgibacillus sp. 6R]KNE18815.1 DeoR family transcriptional regulator [Virgibacillus pantothenticus]MBS7428469.1 DeoR/GlpR transcriptional regulator [Virgibacillus sp. 19R1-5]MED3738496.1 DeoR/GlpR family DNA-binding transcription regulator [Virgibacillus pantothenticus]QTY15242.1 DeoR/GlpR transcriptional regulator [Virgibacillus pantothenticus]